MKFLIMKHNASNLQPQVSAKSSYERKTIVSHVYVKQLYIFMQTSHHCIQQTEKTADLIDQKPSK